MDNKEFNNLVEYIKTDRPLQRILPTAEKARIAWGENMGAILTDAVAQAGLKYQKQVVPIVKGAEKKGYKTVKQLGGKHRDMMEFFNSKDGKISNRKQKAFCGLVAYLLLKEKNTAKEVKKWLSSPANRKGLESAVYGVGQKTSKYLYQLCGGDVVCVDVQIRKYYNRATGYRLKNDEDANRHIEEIMTKAARKLGHSPRQLDSAIWQMMSDRAKRKKRKKKGKKP